MINKMRI